MLVLLDRRDPPVILVPPEFKEIPAPLDLKVTLDPWDHKVTTDLLEAQQDPPDHEVLKEIQTDQRELPVRKVQVGLQAHPVQREQRGLKELRATMALPERRGLKEM